MAQSPPRASPGRRGLSRRAKGLGDTPRSGCEAIASPWATSVPSMAGPGAAPTPPRWPRAQAQGTTWKKAPKTPARLPAVVIDASQKGRTAAGRGVIAGTSPSATRSLPPAGTGTTAVSSPQGITRSSTSLNPQKKPNPVELRAPQGETGGQGTQGGRFVPTPGQGKDYQEKPSATSPFPGLYFCVLARHHHVVSPARKAAGLGRARGAATAGPPVTQPPPLPKSPTLQERGDAASCPLAAASRQTPAPSGDTAGKCKSLPPKKCPGLSLGSGTLSSDVVTGCARPLPKTELKAPRARGTEPRQCWRDAGAGKCQRSPCPSLRPRH